MAEVLQNKGAGANSAWKRWPGGRGQFAAWGSFDGETVMPERRMSGGTALSVGADTEITSDGIANFELPGGTLIRATVTDNGGAPNVSADISEIA